LCVKQIKVFWPEGYISWGGQRRLKK